ncbi:DNA adenine methylase [Dyadobacter pollutisoli]|jgi:DNA adenine methylase|uniref:site-specific DNA-methyltransferase (adenine-specific) n=1 Tax=Dyadobacter pollutisoli TaxID=2910158 RepID=A0A9E8NBD1_9BACT|nr:DNA adenine methylase [Dyadobacter pollutisoli]WAC11901.1 DNA adenine methylase [Dyadobacter pollutisoli]
MNRTPLRYPGGKQKLTPFIVEILECNSIDGHYVEPFAGGAGVALELLLSRRIKNIHLNDSDIRIYAFWHTVKHHSDELCRRISAASLDVNEWKFRREIVKNPSDFDLFEVGFSTFYLNRVNRSGVLNAGLIGGVNQNGNYKMDARFSRNDLIRRIELIGIHADGLNISNLDAEEYITKYIPELPENCLIYLDPPYYNKAKDLYLNSYSKDDHARIAECIQTEIHHRWILSYDSVPTIADLYPERRSFSYDLQYSAARNYKGKEIFIFSDRVNLPKRCGLTFIDDQLLSLAEYQ